MQYGNIPFTRYREELAGDKCVKYVDDGLSRAQKSLFLSRPKD